MDRPRDTVQTLVARAALRAWLEREGYEMRSSGIVSYQGPRVEFEATSSNHDPLRATARITAHHGRPRLVIESTDDPAKRFEISICIEVGLA
jgi:hypothetical protein